MYILEEFIEEYRKLDLTMYFTDVKGPLRDKLSITELTNLIGETHFFLGIHEAVTFFDNEKREGGNQSYILQSNS